MIAGMTAQHEDDVDRIVAAWGRERPDLETTPMEVFGRIYRLAPKGNRPAKVAVDLSTPAGLLAALASPTQSIRFLAYTKLREQGRDAANTLRTAFRDEDPVLRARALWLLAAVDEALGFDWPAWNRFVHNHTLFHTLLVAAYRSLGVQMLITLFALPLSGMAPVSK